jgi:hypothetical protein
MKCLSYATIAIYKVRGLAIDVSTSIIYIIEAWFASGYYIKFTKVETFSGGINFLTDGIILPNNNYIYVGFAMTAKSLSPYQTPITFNFKVGFLMRND